MGTVFNIQHYSIHDGPGIRTVVFLKGCPLRCRWCANPESQTGIGELGWTKGECIGCGNCIKNLKEYGCHFEEDRLFWKKENRPDKTLVDRACPSGALHVIGKEMSVEEVMEEVEKDWQFYISSKGGITISGGEPLLQPDFAYDLLVAAGLRHLHRTVETCGFAEWEIYRHVMSEVDFLLTDIKVMDDAVHKRETGVSNAKILNNLSKISRCFPDLHIQVRTPVIPGVNDDEESLSDIVDFVKEIGADYELLKYHRFGIPKYESLNRPYPMGDAELSEERFRQLEQHVIREFSRENNGHTYGKITSARLNENKYTFIDGGGI